MSTDLPTTPGDALRWARDLLAEAPAEVEMSVLRLLGVWADQLDAAPTTYRLPAEPPPEVTELWSSPYGTHWTRSNLRGTWVSDSGDLMLWWQLVGAVERLSTVPPEPATSSEGERDGR